MLEARGLVLFANPEGWRVAFSSMNREHNYVIENSACEPADVAAKLTAGKLESLGCRSKKIIVALPDEACFSASIKMEGSSGRAGHRELLYLLEEKIPIAAEEGVVHFLKSGKRALGVGTRRQTLDPILAALTKENFKVIAACPAAILAFQGIASARAKSPANIIDALLWQNESKAHLFSMDKGQISGWLSVPAERDDILLGVASLLVSRSEPLRLACVGMERALAHAIKEWEGLEIVCEPGISSDAASLLAASSLFAGSGLPLVNWRGSDGSAQPFGLGQPRIALISALAAALLLVTCTIGALLYRAGRYSDFARQAQGEKESIFRRLYPSQTVPVSIESRLESAVQEIQRNGTGAKDSNPSLDTSISLHEILKSLPADIRYSVSELDLYADHLSLQGEVTSHADADSVVLALRKSPMLSIDDAQTQQGAKGTVQYTIVGTLHGPTKLPRKGS